jgi:hypothetical protein
VHFRLSRLRRGEVIAGAGGLLLLGFLVLTSWYRVRSVRGASTTFTGWQMLTASRWLVLVTIIVGLSLPYFQLTRRAPAIPVILSVIVTVLAAVTTLVLLYRVLINMPGTDGLTDVRLGAYLGLLSALGIAVGGFLSVREEGIAPGDAPAEIPTVRAGGSGGS